jgi:hypothetical protein
VVFNDRLKRAFYAMFKASVPRLDYYALYSAKVISQAGDLFDLQPDDPRIPSMGGVPIRHGLPGVTIRIPRDSTLLVGWENGDPSRPFCALWQGGETNATRITIIAQTIELGGSGLDPIRTGVLNGEAIDPFTGAQHFALGNASQHVRAKKV